MGEAPGTVERAHLPVAEQIDLGQQLFPEQFNALAGVAAAPIVAIREVEGINVPLGGGVAFLNQPITELVGRRDLGAATLADVVEGLLIYLFGGSIMHNIADVNRFVLRTQPSFDPKSGNPHQFLLFAAHRTRNIHHIDDDGVALRQQRLFPRAVAHIVADGHDNGIAAVIVARRNLAAQGFAVGALEVAQRVGAGAPNPTVLVLLADEVLFALGLNVGQLQLFGENGGQILKRDINLQRVLPRLFARLPLARLPVALPDGVADIAIALADAAALLGSIAELGNVNLRHRNRDVALALTPDHLALRHVLTQILFDLTAHNLAEAPKVAVNPFH